MSRDTVARWKRPSGALLAVVPVVAVLALAGAGCSDSGDIEVSSERATTTESETTTSDAETTTSEVDSAADDTEGSSTTSPSGVGDGMTGGSTDIVPDEEAADVSWAMNAAMYTGQNGLRVAFACPPAGTPASLWGAGPFTNDSSVCTAAAFAGLITVADGGRVVIEIAPGEESYTGGEANGISAQPYGNWSGSFIFP